MMIFQSIYGDENHGSGSACGHLRRYVAFSLDGVTMEVPGRTLLQPLTARFATGKTIGLIGHNGSGKSTLLKILARMQEPTAGRVSFEGKPLNVWGNREFARKLAYLPQYTPAASGMLASELVALGRYPWHGALGQFSKADQEKVDEAIELTDTVAFRDRLVDTLSGGERQRVWLAMLVAQNAESLLLDEPISALDMAHQLGVLSLVRDCRAKRVSASSWCCTMSIWRLAFATRSSRCIPAN